MKQAMDYDTFMTIIEQKNNLPLDQLDTPAELKDGEDMVISYTEIQKNKIA